MSGKGKGKGKGKRKGEEKRKEKSGLGKFEAKFGEKCVDLRRFAYDVIKYTALKFRVPENCIGVCDWSQNVYGQDDFHSSICRNVIESQLRFRLEFHSYFIKHYKPNIHASSNLMGIFVQDVIKEALKLADSCMGEIILSLAVLCELFLFLFSKDLSFNPTPLAKCWFQCYLNLNRQRFDNFGGLVSLYFICSKADVAAVDVFLDEFITKNCHSYDKSVEDEEFKDRYLKEYDEISREIYSPSDEESEKESVRTLVRELTQNILVVSVPPKRGVDSEDSLPQNPGLGVPNPHEMYDSPVTAAAETSQNLPEVSAEEQARRAKRAAYLEKKSKKSSNTSRVAQRLGQLSLDSTETKQSSEENPSGSATTDATASCEHLGARPKHRASKKEPSHSHKDKTRKERDL